MSADPQHVSPPQPLPLPSLRERMGARLDTVGVPFTIYFHAQLEGRLDRTALTRALTRVLEDLPRLRLRLAPRWWGYQRQFLAADRIGASELIRFSESAQEFAWHLSLPLDVSSSGPVRLELFDSDTGTRLALVVHHAMADARGVLAIYERLAAHYSHALGGVPPQPPPDPTDGRLRSAFSALPSKEKLAAVRNAFSPVTDMLRQPGERPALFVDAPQAGFSTHRTQTVALSLAQATRLLRWTAKRKGTLTDLLVAAAARAGLQTWPQEAGRTVVVDLAVSLHQQEGEVADRTLGYKIKLPTDSAVEVAELFDRVREQGAEGRGRTPVIVGSFVQVIPSLLPPAMFRNAVGGFIRDNPTGGDSLGVSNLGLFETKIGDFGPNRLTDAIFYSNAWGLRLYAIRAPGSFNIVLSYQAPAITDASVSAFRERFESVLGTLSA